ncbi:MAG TPA: hypothetical protein VH641_16460 [Streptosporangiaceae bacterium]|jgi:hypothetical protein
MRQHGPRQGLIGRALRRIGLDRNPMRRGTDRIEAIARAGLLAAFLVAAPVVTAYLSHEIYVCGLRTARAQAAAWHRVPAVVLTAEPVAARWLPAQPPTRYSVRWATPDGSSRTGEIIRAADTTAGGTLTVWIDDTGRLTHPPLSRADVTGQVIQAAVAVPVVLALLLAAAGGVVSLILDRHRLARWEADWSAVEPQWTGRR